MAQQKTCSGTQTIGNLPLQPPSCNYDLQLFIDGTPITSIVVINSTMTDAQIAALLNANRINNTTGTFTVSTTGVITSITITGIVLASTDSGVYTVTTNTGLPCAELIDGAPVVLTCNLIPLPGGGGGVPGAGTNGNMGRGFVPRQEICVRPNNAGEECPQLLQYRGFIYVFERKDENGNCCYKLRR